MGVDQRYRDALEIAWRRFRTEGPKRLGEEGGATPGPRSNSLVLRFLEESLEIDPDQGRVTVIEPGKPAPGDLELLTLHYLLGVPGISPSGEFASFRELEGGELYYSVYQGRAILPLFRAFGAKPERLLALAERLGAERLKLGDVSLRFPVFPKFPMTLALWRGDDEVPGSANLLLDRRASRILPTEDIADLAAHVAHHLVHLAAEAALERRAEEASRVLRND